MKIIKVLLPEFEGEFEIERDDYDDTIRLTVAGEEIGVWMPLADIKVLRKALKVEQRRLESLDA